ncbi:hypothetical protein [Streptomyces sp. TLI_105]|uniref:hypothetical protein n=1 Tax=Streptomyces sp. TLI_105 TaxID=1881019 RepID=UPI00115FAB25|nr:hypothetical protein [Streptomyces sp. TLI_105]
MLLVLDVEVLQAAALRTTAAGRGRVHGVLARLHPVLEAVLARVLGLVEVHPVLQSSAIAPSCTTRSAAMPSKAATAGSVIAATTYPTASSTHSLISRLITSCVARIARPDQRRQATGHRGRTGVPRCSALSTAGIRPLLANANLSANVTAPRPGQGSAARWARRRQGP